jgi:membrane associated rhomboid family serine protease
MLLPIGDDNLERGHSPVFSYLFIAVNIAVFIFQSSMPDAAQANLFVETWGAIPNEIAKGIDRQTLFTSMFLHGSWLHLLGNMLYLWIFSDNIEGVIGNLRFVVFYLLGGLAAGIAQVVVDPFSGVPCVGASGAIAAVMGAYIVMFPRSRVKMTFLFLFTFYVPAILFLGFWMYQQVASGLEVLGMDATDAGGVAWWAHIGGFVYGLVAGLWYRNRYLDTQNHRLRQL